MAKKNQTYTSAWNEHDPRNDDAKETLKILRGRTRWWRILIFMACILSPLSLMLAASSASSVQSMRSTVDEVSSTSQTEKPGEEAALQSVQSWLSSKDNNPYPGGTANLQWSGATKVASHTDTSEEKVTTDYWSHRFSFTDLASGTTKRVAQLVSVANGVQSSIGAPSILPTTITANAGGTSAALPGYPSMDQSDTLTTLVKQWSKVYVGDDDDALTVLVGDSNTNHLYKAASLGTFNQATINWAAWAGDGHGGAPEQGKGYGAVSVSISYAPTGGPSSATVSTSLSLLISNPEGGAPKVVAWGADSDIKSLRPYGNAVDKELADGSSSTNSTNGSSPSASPSPSTSSSASDDSDK